ncbi:sensor histidine kinase [Marinifilum caeruleilacunae]|uniref:Histidine kinase n=1 Tax=Marinifilum caeruleilacunae TaxID=2499076 RepID=A0ABX1X208_9BACT|nr:histidine kinase [Marinifilum caeruleilacunae]NOU62120.1 histidine kinase [Marinifilum caeruleilacunae]
MKRRLYNNLIRLFLVSIYAIFISGILKVTLLEVVGFKPPINERSFWISYLILFNLNTEFNYYLDKYLNNHLPWFFNNTKRVILQFSCMILSTLIIIGIPFVIWYIKIGQSLSYPISTVILFITFLIFLLNFMGIPVAINFHRQMQKYSLEVEQLKREKLKADYKVLQNQVDPHFLFNNFNVLIAEISYNPDKAIEFTRKLSKVYRYVLQSKNHDLIEVDQELQFIKSYIYLHQVRIGNALNFSLNVSDAALNKQLPPLTLQILVENAIKHNIANDKNPLNVSIQSCDDNTLIVKNNLNPKSELHSTFTGLSNIKSRYELLKKEGFSVEQNLSHFTVRIPLIEE